MPLGTLERTAPSLFRQGPSPLSRLVLYSALALFFMVADARFQVTEPVRTALATALYPLQWLMYQPVHWARQGQMYLEELDHAQARTDDLQRKMVLLGLRAGQADALDRENTQLRELLALRPRLNTPNQAAQVLYDSPNMFSRRVTLDKGLLAGIQPGSPVMDAAGVLGQVTRVYPMLSEVTLLTDRDQAIPVLNVRTGARSVAYGVAQSADLPGSMELRFTPSNIDVQEGDLLTTSGVDGLYPPGLPVARVVSVHQRADSTFSRIYCAPLAQTEGVRNVLVLQPLAPPTVEELPPPAATPPQPRENTRYNARTERRSSTRPNPAQARP